jgi:endonuclease/exonuclease/phosphatase family metal-dependent hydrolase
MQSTSITWRIATWNIHGSHQRRLADIAHAIADLHPDAVALQEVQRHQAASIAGQLHWHVVWARKHYPLHPKAPWRAEGLAIVSPHPLSEPFHASISPGVHIATYRHRIVHAATVTAPAGRLRLFNTHLATDSDDTRIAQARSIANTIRTDAVTPVALAGDLNSADEPAVLREFHAAGLRDPGGDFTSPSIRPRQRIDYVLVPESARVTPTTSPDGGQHWHELSDHLPALATFELER